MKADLVLVERRPRICRLAPDEASFLLAHHRAHLELVPLGGRRWRVTSLGVAGILPTPQRRIVIRPRLPEANLAWLLGLRDAEGAASLGGEPMLEMAARLLAELLDATAATGLQRGYRERREAGPALIGAIDAPAQMRASPAGRAVLHGIADAQTATLPCNEVPLALGRRLLGSPWLSPAGKGRLASALVPWHEAGDRPLSPELLTELESSPSPQRYAPLLGACRALLASPGADGSSALLVSLQRLWERHLERLAARAVADLGLECQAQRTFTACAGDGDRPGVGMRPDAAILRESTVLLALDAKWKRLPEAAVVTDDFYQALAYAAALGARRAMLVYPGRRRHWDFALAGVTVQVRAMPVAGDLRICQRAEQRLEREIRAACR